MVFVVLEETLILVGFLNGDFNVRQHLCFVLYISFVDPFDEP